jgi:hypothetical protein
MDWITFERRGFFPVFFAVHSDGRLSSELAHPDEVDCAAKELKRQIDVAARRMKLELQRRVPLFGEDDA